MMKVESQLKITALPLTNSKKHNVTSPTFTWYLQINILPPPYHFVDLKHLVKNCQNKPKGTRDH